MRGAPTLCALVAVLTTVGCFDPGLQRCQVTCGFGETCPPGALCLDDGVCHAAADEPLCSAAADDAGAGAIDAAVSDAGATADAGPGDPDAGPRGPGLAGELLVTEIMKNPCARPGIGQTCVVNDSSGEWFEVHNPLAEPLDLAGLLVRDVRGQSFVIDPSTIVPAGGYAVLAISGDLAANGGVLAAFDYADFTLDNNSSDRIELVAGEVLIDAVEYDDVGFPDDEGASMALDPASLDPVGNDVGTAWCSGQAPFGAGDFGSPGAANPACP